MSNDQDLVEKVARAIYRANLPDALGHDEKNGAVDQYWEEATEMAKAAITALSTQPSVADEVKVLREAAKEAAIAWEVCASIHREYAVKKDPFFKTRQEDFMRHADKARAALASVKE